MDFYKMFIHIPPEKIDVALRNVSRQYDTTTENVQTILFQKNRSILQECKVCHDRKMSKRIKISKPLRGQTQSCWYPLRNVRDVNYYKCASCFHNLEIYKDCSVPEDSSGKYTLCKYYNCDNVIQGIDDTFCGCHTTIDVPFEYTKECYLCHENVILVGKFYMGGETWRYIFKCTKCCRGKMYETDINDNLTNVQTTKTLCEKEYCSLEKSRKSKCCEYHN